MKTVLANFEIPLQSLFMTQTVQFCTLQMVNGNLNRSRKLPAAYESLCKANTALLTKTPTDFDKYVTAAYYFTRKITVTILLTPTITNKTEWRIWAIRDKRPLLQSKRHTADENTDSLYLIRDCRRLLFHKNDYSDEFIDTNYYKQNKQNDDFELYMTKDRFLQSIRDFADENTDWLW